MHFTETTQFQVLGRWLWHELKLLDDGHHTVVGASCYLALDNQLALILTSITGQHAAELQGAIVLVEDHSGILAQHTLQLRFTGGATRPAQLRLAKGFVILSPAQYHTFVLKILIRQLVAAGQVQSTLLLDGNRGLGAIRDAHILER